jgi:hypothetical protein
MVNTKVVGLQIHSHLNWKNCTEQMIPKLSGASYAIRLMVHISNINTFKSIYCEKVRIMAGAQSRISCKGLFEQSEILSVSCQYILSLMNFIICFQEMQQQPTSTHSINTRNKQHLHRINAEMSCFQKTVHFLQV